MKKIIFPVLLFSSLSLILSFCDSVAANSASAPQTLNKNASAQSMDQIVAIVNDAIITQNQLNAAWLRMKEQLKATGGKDAALSDGQLKQKVLQKLIDRELTVQVAAQQNIKVTDKDIDLALQHMAQANHLTVAALKQQLQAQKMNYNSFREDLRKQITIEKMEGKATAGRINVTSADIEKYRNKYLQRYLQATQLYHVYDFLVPLEDNATAQQAARAKAQALTIKKQLQQGNSAENIETAYEDLSWRALQFFPELFIASVRTLKAGETAGPIKAPNGYHILLLKETKAGTNKQPVMPGDDVIKRMVIRVKINQEMHKILKHVRETSYIKILNSNG